MHRNPCPNSWPVFGLILLSAAAGPAAAGTTYRERMLLPRETVFEARLEDVSRANAPSEPIAITQIESPQVPIAFALGYDDGRVGDAQLYVVRARIMLNGTLMFTSDTAYPVLGRGGANHVDILLRRAGDTAAAPL